MNNLSDFHGPNAGYVLDLYERYRHDPQTVDAATRRYFEQWDPSALLTEPAVRVNGAPVQTTDAPTGGAAQAMTMDMQKVASVANLAQAIREYGHLGAHLDPLGGDPPGDPTLDPAYHGLTETDLRRLPANIVGGPLVEAADNAWEAIQALRQVYSTHTGYDYDHVRMADEREPAACSRAWFESTRRFIWDQYTT